MNEFGQNSILLKCVINGEYCAKYIELLRCNKQQQKIYIFEKELRNLYLRCCFKKAGKRLLHMACLVAINLNKFFLELAISEKKNSECKVRYLSSELVLHSIGESPGAPSSYKLIQTQPHSKSGIRPCRSVKCQLLNYPYSVCVYFKHPYVQHFIIKSNT